ncbi:hypothetical protein L873DRAFT_1818836 [Choiromyces venosus 120613-1]|uniref:Uncharacterized protein n=1 Tax=Choiromyces venosus 120613-1 TaxID=1336337 RepID=A0A3N4J3X2_9PEZI|nr:hypothetical protein L873DRAFT_1818836 [Choiromyces venosus 120613-1]
MLLDDFSFLSTKVIIIIVVERRRNNKEKLWEVMQEEWEAIHQSVLNSLIDSLPDRLRAIVAGGGGHIKW